MFLSSHLDCCIKYVGPHFFKDKSVLVLGKAAEDAKRRLENDLGAAVNCLNCDVLLHWGLLSRLDHIDAHIEHATKHCTYMILETEVLDAAESICTRVTTDFTTCAKPSAAYVETMLRRHGWKSQMILDEALNNEHNRYDWPVRETWQHRPEYRRMWICWNNRARSPINSQTLI